MSFTLYFAFELCQFIVYHPSLEEGGGRGKPRGRPSLSPVSASVNTQVNYHTIRRKPNIRRPPTHYGCCLGAHMLYSTIPPLIDSYVNALTLARIVRAIFHCASPHTVPCPGYVLQPPRPTGAWHRQTSGSTAQILLWLNSRH